MSDTQKIGIDAVAVHVPEYFIDLKTLAFANQVDPDKYTIGLGCRRMAVAAPDEDPVTMAVRAATTLLKNYSINPRDIGMLIVGSESGVDGAKPIASYVHGMLGLPSCCRSFDTKHACYSATAGLRMAADWCAVRSASTGKKALVIATDVARYSVGSAGEPTQGAGAVALLIGPDARVLEFDPYPEAVHTEEVMDFWRPSYRSTALVDGDASINSYLDSLVHTYSLYQKASDLDINRYDHLLFHVPFPKMAYKAFSRLYELEVSQRRNGVAPLDQEYAARTEPSLWANRELGNIYSGSLYLSLAGLLERSTDPIGGTRAGLFSYGSGSCGEYFSGRLGTDPQAWKGRTGMEEGLKKRVELDYRKYLEFRWAGERLSYEGSYFEELIDPAVRSDGIAFLGIRDHQRIYATYNVHSDRASEPAKPAQHEVPVFNSL